MYDKAIVKLNELSELVPESDKVKFYSAAVYQELKKPELAVKNFSEIQPASNHYEEARIQAAMIYRNTNRAELAIETIKESIKNKPDGLQSYLFLSQLFEDQKKLDDAISNLKLADAKFPKNPQVNYFLGTLFDKKDDKENMFFHMNKVVSIDENHVQALNYLAYSLADQNKDLNKAEELALKAHSLDKSDAFIKDTVGWVYFQKGDYKRAVQFLEKAHQDMPDVGVIAEHLGDAYAKLKQNKKASDLFEKAAGLENDEDKKTKIKNKIVDLEKSNEQINQNSGRMPAGE